MWKSSQEAVIERLGRNNNVDSIEKKWIVVIKEKILKTAKTVKKKKTGNYGKNRRKESMRMPES